MNIKEVCETLSNVIIEAARVVYEMTEPLRTLFEDVLDNQEKIDKEKRLRQSWTVPKIIIKPSQVDMRKPKFVTARANL